jgi:MFS family permease
MGVGSIAGALASGARGHVSPRILTAASAGFGASTQLAAAAPTFALQMLALVPLGAMSVTFAAGVNSTLQLAVEPELRGRVMALYSVVFVGSTPVGGPIAGWLAEVSGPRAGLVLGGVAALLAAVVARRAFARAGAAPAAAAVAVVPVGAGATAACAVTPAPRRLARVREARHAVARRYERARRS